MTERPPNVRPARTIDRNSVSGGYNARRPAPEAHGSDSRGDDNQIANRAYRGNHRAGGQHHFDHQTAAEQRSSRVGRHHVEPPPDWHDDYFNR